MRQLLPGRLCEHEYFKQCFTAGQERCQKQAARQFEVCLDKHAGVVPQSPNAASGKRAGKVIGRCVGIQLEIALAKKGLKNSSAKCNDASNWL